MKVVLKLDELLKERNISTDELSRLSYVSTQVINRMRNNTIIELPLRDIAKICIALNCDIDDILILKRGQSQ